MIGALILKEFTGASDDDICSSLMFDIHYQYALHTTSFLEQPMSDRTLGRFRERCLSYKKQTGVDLLHDTITSLSQEMAELMKVDHSLKRMDSMMVASNIKKMSRLELLYTCVANLAVVLQRNGKLPEGLQHYTQDCDRNNTIYHNRADDTSAKIDIVLKDASCLMELCDSKYEENQEYQTLTRALDEQAVKQEDGTYRLRQKGEGMHTDCLQNPADPDATYREKAGKQNRGYVANVIEESGENGTAVIKCANGQTPKSCSYNARTGQCTVSFHKSQCEGCPYASQCKRKVFKRTVRLTISIKSKHRAQQQRSRATDEFKGMLHFRNGVETIPSFLRRLFDVDHMPVRGKLRTKFFFGCKIGGLNFLKFCKYEQSVAKCAQNGATS